MNTHRVSYPVATLLLAVLVIGGIFMQGFVQTAEAMTPSVTIVSSSVSKNPLTAGATQNLSATIGSVTALSNAIVDLRIYNSNNVLITRKGFSGVYIKAGGKATFAYSYLSPTTLPPGTYNMQVGVWSANYATTHLYETPRTFTVVAPTTVAPKITLVSSSVSGDPLVSGTIQNLSTTIGSATSLSNLIVDIRIYNSSNVMITRKGFSGVNIAAGGTATLKYAYQSSTTLSPGTYTMQVGVWNSTYATTYYYGTAKTFLVVSGTTAGLSAPGGLRTTAILATQIDLAWNASTGATGYRLERCIGLGCTSFTQIGIPTGTTFSSTGLTGGKVYTYRVRAVNSTGVLSGYSAPLSVLTPAVPLASPVLTESAHGTSITTTGTIIDANLAKWTIVGGVVYKDGVATISGNVTLLLYWNHIVYQQNAAGGWWNWVNGGWQSASDPRVTTSAPTVPIGTTPKVTLVSSSVSNTILTAGAAQTASVTLGSATSLSNLIVNLMIYNSAGTLVGIKDFGSVNIAAGATATFAYDYMTTTSLSAGTYQLRVGVWGSTWSPTYLYETPQTFSVISGTGESTHGTSITTTGTITDANGTKWTVVGGIVYKDGVATISGNVTLLLYWNHIVYQQNAAGGWWNWVNGGWQSASDPRVTTPTTAPAPAPSTITMVSGVDQFTYAGPYLVQNNMWGTVGLAEGSYWQKAGIGPLTTNNSVSARWQWSYPDGPNEVKGYPAIGIGQKPGYASTPNSNMPKLVDSVTSAVSSWDVQSTYTGMGQLTYDLWLTRDAIKYSNFPTTPITHEIMLTVDSFGGYGEARNPAWYFGTTVIEGKTYKVWKAECFGGAQCWRFIVLQMVNPTHLLSGTVNFKPIFTYLKSVGLITGQEYLSSIEFGNEMQYGTGDVFVKDFKATVW